VHVNLNGSVGVCIESQSRKRDRDARRKIGGGGFVVVALRRMEKELVYDMRAAKLRVAGCRRIEQNGGRLSFFDLVCIYAFCHFGGN
jgi:hypothetical protein